jgi:Rod binding domain-containing protein
MMTIENVGKAEGVNKDYGKLKRAAEDFEEYFVLSLLKEMRKSVDSVNEGGGSQKDIYNSMVDERMAKMIVKSGTFGLAKQMINNMGLAASKYEASAQDRPIINNEGLEG